VLQPSDNTGANITVTINGSTIGTYHPTGQIVVYGQAGSDSISLQTAKFGHQTVSIIVPAILYAGSGSSTLSATGSTAANILIGGPGNDSLQGGSGRDILVGGGGSDTLQQGSGGDILIGDNLAALEAIRAEWSRLDLSYTNRIDHLTGATSGGYNGSYFLTTATVHNDGAVDYLYGGSGSDWYFAHTSGSNVDVIDGRKKNELVTSI
jgi:Ca2+-binding RTX toxin-like protein